MNEEQNEIMRMTDDYISYPLSSLPIPTGQNIY